MDLTISRPIRIIALVAIVVAAGGGAMLALHTSPQTAAPPVVVQHQTAATSTAGTHSAAKATAAKAATKPGSTLTAPPTSRARTTPKATQTSAVGANGLPTMLDAALRKHRVVVVSLFNPQSQTDAISYAEARAGASVAGVGFVGVDLLDSVVAGALTTSLPGGGLLPEPGVLIYRRPGMLVERLDGFNDRDVVAQAALASATASPLVASSTSTSAAAPTLPTAPAPGTTTPGQ